MQLGNHLGNVLVTISDKKKGIADPLNAALIKYFEPVMLSGTDYYPFGMAMRIGGDTSYRYGFNGKENDNEVKGGDGLQQDYGMRVYDNRLGRFLSVDPITADYPELTPFQFASNRPIDGIDLDGLEHKWIIDWLADKAKAKGHPRLSGFIRSFGGTDPIGTVVQAANAAAKGDLSPTTQILYSGTPIGMLDNNLKLAKKAIVENDPEAQGELLGVLTQTAVGAAKGSKGGTNTKPATPSSSTNAQVSRANSGNSQAINSNSSVKNYESFGSEVQASQSATPKNVIGLGIDGDLINHRGTGAVTYKNAGWQNKGLSKVDWGKQSMDEYSFKSSFWEATEKADLIRFDVTNFNPAKSGMTQYEFNYILDNPTLKAKTQFVKDGKTVTWDGSKFVDP